MNETRNPSLPHFDGSDLNNKEARTEARRLFKNGQLWLQAWLDDHGQGEQTETVSVLVDRSPLVRGMSQLVREHGMGAGMVHLCRMLCWMKNYLGNPALPHKKEKALAKARQDARELLQEGMVAIASWCNSYAPNETP